MPSDVDPKTLAYEAEVAPRWAEPFARLLLNVAPIDPKAMVLDVLCGTGSTSVPLLERLEQRGRVVALDPSSARLAIARRKAGSVVGKRLFFRHEKLERFSFTDDVFDVVVSNAGVLDLADSAVLAECLRVAKPGGTLAMTLALRGTFQELFDFLREVLERREDEDALRRLDAHIHSYPGDDEALSRFESLGLADVTLSRSTFPIEFPSGRALLGSELAQQLFVEKWLAVAGTDAAAIFQELTETIDTYLGSDPLELTVQAACLVGRKDLYELVEVASAGSAVGFSAGHSFGLPSLPPPPPPSDAPADDSDDLAADEVTPVRSVAIPLEAAASEPSEASSTPILPATPMIAPGPVRPVTDGARDGAAPPAPPTSQPPPPTTSPIATTSPTAPPSPIAAQLSTPPTSPTPAPAPSATLASSPSASPATTAESPVPAEAVQPPAASLAPEGGLPEGSEIFATREPSGASASLPPQATPSAPAPARKGPPPLPPPARSATEPRAAEGTGASETTSGSSSAPAPGRQPKKRR